MARSGGSEDNTAARPARTVQSRSRSALDSASKNPSGSIFDAAVIAARRTGATGELNKSSMASNDFGLPIAPSAPRASSNRLRGVARLFTSASSGSTADDSAN
jgi:hypothetical protein